ncbi:carbohydrate-binding protein [Rufibacter tibetensis]|uniref:carbohydrate-binding protein n=1 Tax=Rufibacter tibetensis TaxID=512763 RepID=UPI0007853A57|nr:carbohydrate-binding protein [Rufibacter tibetensis]
MKLGFLRSFIALSLFLSSFSAFSQQPTANERVTPYTAIFGYGSNMGYYANGWNDRNLAGLVSKAGGNSIRPTLPETFVDTWGYNVRLSEFQYYANTLGMKEITCFIEGPTEAHRDKTTYPGAHTSSKVFANLYVPIWNADGTVNPNNYYANYVFKLVQTYGPYVKNWEVYNEPDIGNNNPTDWLTRAPLPGEMENIQAPFSHYIRMLRITWEVVKKYNPDDHVTPGGIGHSTYLDALLRYTDNPNGGTVTSEFPHKGGAYFDMVSYHVYPSFFLRVWDNSIGGFKYLRNSDYAAAQVINHKNGFEAVLQKYGYNGATYPKKHYIVTETNISRRTNDWRYGSDEMQRNFGIKAMVLAQKNEIKQIHIYGVGENVTAPGVNDLVSSNVEYGLMGLYENLTRDAPGVEKFTQLGSGIKTTSQLLLGFSYDAGQTAALNLPAGVEGGAFRKGTELVYVLWAKNPNDKTENYTQPYSFPSSLNISKLDRFEWDFGTTGAITQAAPTGLTLNTSPSFFKATTSSVTKQNQTITFAPIGAKTIEQSPTVTLEATASSGLTVAFNVTSGPATLSGNTLTLTGTGTVTVEATQSGNTTYNAAPAVTQSFEVTSSTQANSTRIEAERYTSMSGVQVENTSDVGGGQNVGYIDTNDWMNYSVSVSSAGTYNVSFRVATGNTGGRFEVRSASGAVLATVDVPQTGGWQAWQTVSAPVALAAGTQTLQLYVRGGGWNINWLEIGGTFTTAPTANVTPIITFPALANKMVGDADFTLNATSTNTTAPITFTSSNPSIVSVSNSTGIWKATVVGAGTANITALQAASSGYNAAENVTRSITVTQTSTSTAKSFPGLIQAEAYDGMFGMQKETTGDTGGGQNLGYVDDNDWVDYRVNAASAGTYTLNLRVASTSTTGIIEVRNSAAAVLGSVSVPNTGGWQTYTTLKTTVTLPAGEQTLRIYARKGAWNFNWFEGVSSSSSETQSQAVITFPALIERTVGNPSFELTATSTNTSTPISFTSANPGVVSVSNASGKWMATIVAAGTATITASQPAGSGYLAANNVSQQQVVNPASTTTSAKAFPGLIQAEAYDAMFGVQKETTGDAGGGQNVGYTDANDWMNYSVSVASAGTYTINLRVASPNNTGAIEVRNSAGTTLASVAVPNTGGWQTWQTVSVPVALTSGTQILQLYVKSGGWNINWFEGATSTNTTIVSTAKSFPGLIQAEAYDGMFGMQKETTGDTGGGQNLGYVDDNDWVDYRVNAASAGTYTLNLRVASTSTTGIIEVRNSAAAVLGSVSVPNTGGWQTYTTLKTTVTLPAGEQTLRIYARKGAWNFNWFEGVSSSSTSTSTTLAQAPSSTGSITVQVQFATTPTSASASFADMKYNKSLGFLFVSDDGHLSNYNLVYKVLNGGTAIDGKTYPKVTYTDGAGNSVGYKWSFAINGRGDETGNTVYTQYPQLIEMVKSGFDLMNHTDSHGGFHRYKEIKDLEKEIFQNTGYRTRTGVIPTADEGFVSAWMQEGYKFVGSTFGVAASRDGYDAFVNWNDRAIIQSMNTNHLLVSRFNMDGMWKADLGSADSWVDGMFAAAANGNKIMAHAFSHGPGGAGEVQYFKQFIDYVKNHPSNNDKVWIAGAQEFAEYFETKENVVKSEVLSGNTLTITLDLSKVSDRNKLRDMSLLVNSSASISGVTVTGADGFSYNLGTKLINIYEANENVSSPFIDPTPPQITSVKASGNKLTITYDKAVTQSGVAGYEVAGNSVTSMTGSGTTWTLSLQTNWVSGQKLTYRMHQGNAAGNGLKVTSYIEHPIDTENASVIGSSTRIEAERYTNMSGVQVENTSDVGGGQNLSYIDPNDWMNYSVNVSSSGTYTINLRVASPINTGAIEVRNSNGTVLGSVNVPNTGGWQNWQTVSVPVNLVSGTQTLQLYVRGGGWNFNWLEIGSGMTQVQSATSISSEEDAFAIKWNIYPNPTPDKVQVQIGKQITGEVSLELINAAGKVIKHSTLKKTSEEVTQTIPLEDLTNGMYFLRLRAKGFSEVKKIIKQ